MDWIKPLINVIKDAVIAIIGYMSGKAAAEKKQAEKALEVSKKNAEIAVSDVSAVDKLRDGSF